MKKALSLLLALVMCLSLCACGGNENKTTSPDSENKETQGNSQSADRRESMTKAEIEEKVESEAMWYVMNHLENSAYSTVFALDSTRYKIGSMVEFEDYKYEVSGTLYLYDKYGSVKGTATFTCSCIWINKDGEAVSVGGVEVDVDY